MYYSVEAAASEIKYTSAFLTRDLVIFNTAN